MGEVFLSVAVMVVYPHLRHAFKFVSAAFCLKLLFHRVLPTLKEGVMPISAKIRNSY
jgi:hypothetical protein